MLGETRGAVAQAQKQGCKFRNQVQVEIEFLFIYRLKTFGNRVVVLSSRGVELALAPRRPNSPCSLASIYIQWSICEVVQKCFFK